jgi:hypothetical protein
VSEIFYRFCGILRGFESGCEVNKIDGELNDPGFGNDHVEVIEISHAATRKYPLQSSSKGLKIWKNK